MLPISVCIICKNEEQNLERFFTALRKYDWELIFVDTGSTDCSRDIALKYTDKVFDFPWINDFSAARNYSISQASNDMILILDCDEFLLDVDIQQVLLLMEQHPEDIGCIQLQNHTNINGTDTIVYHSLNRFFNRKFYHYTGAVHEQTTRIDHKSIPPFYQLPLTVDHQGYNLPLKEKAQKSKRDRDILLEELKKDPQNPYLLFQTGKTYDFENDSDKALTYYVKAISSPNFNPEEEYTIHLLLAYGNCLLDTGHYEAALSMIDVESILSTYADYYCLLGRIYYSNKQPLQAMMAFIKALACEKEIVEGSRYNIPHYNIGFLNEQLGDINNAIMQYRLCENFPMASKRLEELNIN